MMRLRTVGVTLVAALAVGSATAATAFAEAPEFGRCAKVAKGTGSFKSGNCTAALAGGNWEWLPGPGVNNKFSVAKTSALWMLERVGGGKIVCTGASGTGEYTGPHAVGAVAITLTGCEAGFKCNSIGQADGVVVLNPLEGTLGVIKKGATPNGNKIGLDLFPAGKEPLVAQLACGGPLIEIRGSVIVPVSTNKMLLTSTLNFVQKKGKQKPQQFEGEPKDVLEFSFNGGPFGQAGMAFEAKLTNEEPIEVNSVV
jgi:hypothetical protein